MGLSRVVEVLAALQALERQARHIGKQEDNLVEVGIEGVALNPNRQ